jgi:hypothetical protein
LDACALAASVRELSSVDDVRDGRVAQPCQRR